MAKLLAPFVVVAGLIVCSRSSSAIELRGIELGDTCDHAIQHELALHAQPSSPVARMLANRLLGFDDATRPGEPRRIIYRCDDGGHVENYLIKTDVHDEAQAKALYARLKAELVSRAGPPDIDSAHFNARQMELLRGLFTSASAQWKDLKGEELSLNAGLPDAQGHRSVTVSVGWPIRKRTSTQTR